MFHGIDLLYVEWKVNTNNPNISAFVKFLELPSNGFWGLQG